MPSCGCEDWHRYHWPCKHFCAIFQLTSCGWNELRGCYRDSPFFSIDDGVLRAQPGSQCISHRLTEDSTPLTADVDSVSQPISDDSQSVKRCAMECRQTTLSVRSCRHVHINRSDVECSVTHPYQQPVHQQFPANTTTCLYFLADVPHLLKNIGVNIIIART